MIFIVSLAASTGITGLAFVGLPAVETETLYLVFLGSFLLSAVPTAFAVLPKRRNRPTRPKGPSLLEQLKTIGNEGAYDDDWGDDDGSDFDLEASVRESFRSESKPSSSPPGRSSGRSSTRSSRGGTKVPGASKQPDVVFSESFDKAAEKGEEEEKEADPQSRGVVLEADKVDKPKALSQKAVDQKNYLATFISESLKHVEGGSRKMDKYNKFGVNMFIAGATQILGRDRNLDMQSCSRILSELVLMMGVKQQQATQFADKYEEYLQTDSRYMGIFQAGRNAMHAHMRNDGRSLKLLAGALVEWNAPKPKDDTTGPVTVMFTDMVGSTNLTQSKGDAVAQEVVRAHNQIVRDALEAFNGKEIKHTGDGIMASFPNTSNSVEAAIIIQRKVRDHNADNPDNPLRLKVGINAGEPIEEDDDLFGTTVQLSARIVDKAASEQVFVSEIVRGICAGKDFRFANRGPYDLKGFEAPVTLYEVIWDEAAPIEESEIEDIPADMLHVGDHELVEDAPEGLVPSSEKDGSQTPMPTAMPQAAPAPTQALPPIPAPPQHMPSPAPQPAPTRQPAAPAQPQAPAAQPQTPPPVAAPAQPQAPAAQPQTPPPATTPAQPAAAPAQPKAPAALPQTPPPATAPKPAAAPQTKPPTPAPAAAKAAPSGAAKQPAKAPPATGDAKAGASAEKRKAALAALKARAAKKTE